MRLMKMCLALATAGLLASGAAAEKLPLNAISGYLNKLVTARGAFTQINEDGTISTGEIMIKRPGRARFEYSPPEGTIVVAGNREVVIVDKRSNEAPETYPLRRTPLSIILAENVDLGRAKMVTGHSFDGTATVVTAQDPEHPEFGNIQMLFTANPIELRQWVINDGDGFSTTIVLGELRAGVPLRNSLFDTTELKAREDR